MTTTIFLPQSRMLSRKSRSLSVNGRSAEVTKRTRSERGTKSRVMVSCSRWMALVPGVSTTLISLRSSTGAVMMSKGPSSDCRPVSSPYLSRHMRSVVGVTPFSRTAAPISALMHTLLPALNSPTTTRRKSSSSCWMEFSNVPRSSASTSRSARATCNARRNFRSLARSFSCCTLRMRDSISS